MDRPFIIHSLKLLKQALDLEMSLAVECYIPGRDTPQTHGDEILPINLNALKNCGKDVYVIWDGDSHGTMFDMGMAYALGKDIYPVELVQGRSWPEYFKSKIGKVIKCVWIE